MRRVSSGTRLRGPAGCSFPLISTSGGFPGDKNKSLILAEVRNMEASRVGAESGADAATAGSDATAAPPMAPAARTLFVVGIADIGKRKCWTGSRQRQPLTTHNFSLQG